MNRIIIVSDNAKPLPEPVVTYYQMDPLEQFLCEIWIKINYIEEYEFEGIICKMTIICRDLNVSISRNIMVLAYDDTYHYGEVYIKPVVNTTRPNVCR